MKRFHPSNQIHPTAIIYDNVELGLNNIIGPFSVIGSNGEIRGKEQEDFKGVVIIGDNNVISEHVTIQRPFDAGKETRIGNSNLIMAHSHIGHDAVVGNYCEVCSGTIVGGYAVIEDGAKLKLGSIIRNRKTVATKTIVGMGGVVVSDTEPDTTVVGIPAKRFTK